MQTFAQKGSAMPKSLIGVNIEWSRDWGRSQMYANIVRHARKPAKASNPWGSSASTDSQGNPTEDFFMIIKTDTPSLNGTYKVSFDGRASIRAEGSHIKFNSQAYDAGNNRTTADMVVSGGNKMDDIWLYFTGTSGGVKNLKIMRPGHGPDELFNRQFLKSLKPFGHLRFMDLLETNENVTPGWSARRLPHHLWKRNDHDPECYEHIIALCNALKKDLWLNIPCMADDDHVTKLLQLIKEKLDPNLVVYIEWGNELWNSQFKATQAHWAAAKGEAGAHGYANHYFDRTARRLADSIRIARTFLAKDRVRGIIGGQIANTYVSQRQFEYMKSKGINVKDYIYAIAVAPYVNVANALQSSKTVTAQQYAQALFDRADTSSWWSKHFALAATAGVKMVCYEGGVDLGQIDASVPAKIASQLLPIMREMVQKHLKAWFATGGAHLYTWYNLCSTYNKNGIWGLTPDINDLSVPKYEGVLGMAEAKQWVDVVDAGGVVVTPTPTPTPTPVQPSAPINYNVEKIGEELVHTWQEVANCKYEVFRTVVGSTMVQESSDGMAKTPVADGLYHVVAIDKTTDLRSGPSNKVDFKTTVDPEPLPQVLSVDCGSPADKYFRDGKTINRGDIEAVGVEYESERYDVTGYDFQMASGKYDVKLHFIETYDRITAAGQRVFGVAVNGQELPEVDVFKEVGSRNVPLIRNATVDALDGKISITFQKKVQSPMISWIEISPAAILPVRKIDGVLVDFNDENDKLIKGKDIAKVVVHYTDSTTEEITV